MYESMRRWYAMRDRLQKAGKWKHGVPPQEEGEPPTKKPRSEPTPTPTPTPSAAPAAAESDESIPPLEDPPTAEGRYP